MTENANESPPIYCFFLLYCLNLIAQFDKLFLRTLKNTTPEDQTERNNLIFETPETRERKKKLRLRHARITQKRDFETHQKPRFRDFEIEPKFPETHVFRVTILYPFYFAKREFKILLRRRQRERHSNNFAGTSSTVLVHLSSSLPTMWIV